MSSSERIPVLALITLLLTMMAVALAAGPLAAVATAAPEWRLEQPEPPPPVSGQPSSEICQGPEGTDCHRTLVGLGRIGDIEFLKPNLGLLITSGNGGTLPAGIWVYNGAGWHELANVCGASDGRIAWADEDEFWTVSDGRPGQAANSNGVLPPLEDNTLCHFAFNEATKKLEVVGSYAAPPFQANSYQAMQAAACLSPTDCWFGGGPLPSETEVGAFHLHWDGDAVEAEPNTHAVDAPDMQVFEGKLWESLELPAEGASGFAKSPIEILHPPVLQEITTLGGAHTFEPLHPTTSPNAPKEPQLLPQYAFQTSGSPRGASFPQALSFLHLSATEGSLWAAAGPVETPPAGSAPGALTVLHDTGGVWTQVLGPAETGEEEESESIAVDPPDLEGKAVSSIAAEPNSANAWLALDTNEDLGDPKPTLPATLARVGAEGAISEEQVPSEEQIDEGLVGAKGAASKIVCPAQNDCWLATTQGWLFHLSEAADRTLPADVEPAWNGELVTVRPRDQGLPQEPSDSQVSEEAQEEAKAPLAPLVKQTTVNPFAMVTVPLLSDVHSRLVHGSTLELSFHLAVRARVRLLAKRHAKTIASTPMRTLKAGRRSLLLRLDPRRWPTKLDLQTHALAPLPQVSSLSSGVETISTSLAFPKALRIAGWGPSL
jgi:hypothetical protein